MPDRVILVSNRLPVTIHKSESGLEIQPSSGGLATALRSFNAGAGLTWFGWPGVCPARTGRPWNKLCSRPTRPSPSSCLPA